MAHKATGGFSFTSRLEDREWLQNCWVGLLRERFSWEDSGEELQSECGNKISVRYMGDNAILIQNLSDFVGDKLVEEMNEWVKYWFEWLKPWQESDVCHRRRIWTRWLGVPLHSWGERFFRLISTQFGSFIALDDITTRKDRFDFARVQLSVPYSSDINKEFTVEIDGRSFKIKIIEEFPMEPCHVPTPHNQINGEVEMWSSDSGDSQISGSAMATIHGHSLDGEVLIGDKISIQDGYRSGHTEDRSINEPSGDEPNIMGKLNSHADLAAVQFEYCGTQSKDF